MQCAFINALAACGCVDEACRAVGRSPSSAYALRARAGAGAFRLAWDFALDHAIRILADAATSRAIYGVAQPIFYRGEQVGERRHYDERLTTFLLRTRDPGRFGRAAELAAPGGGDEPMAMVEAFTRIIHESAPEPSPKVAKKPPRAAKKRPVRRKPKRRPSSTSSTSARETDRK